MSRDEIRGFTTNSSPSVGNPCRVDIGDAGEHYTAVLADSRRPMIGLATPDDELSDVLADLPTCTDDGTKEAMATFDGQTTRAPRRNSCRGETTMQPKISLHCWLGPEAAPATPAGSTAASRTWRYVQ